MSSRIIPATLTALALCPAGSLAAQTGSGTCAPNCYVETSITFVVPVNLTQLSPDLEWVKFICLLTSAVLNPVGFFGGTVPIPQDSVPVASGQVVTTMRIVFPILNYWLQDPVGKQADYQCGLQGYSKLLKRWDFFSDTAPDPVFRLNPVPPVMQGSFVW